MVAGNRCYYKILDICIQPGRKETALKVRMIINLVSEPYVETKLKSDCVRTYIAGSQQTVGFRPSVPHPTSPPPFATYPTLTNLQHVPTADKASHSKFRRLWLVLDTKPQMANSAVEQEVDI